MLAHSSRRIFTLRWSNTCVYSIENITKEAIKHIHTGEIILTIGKSAIVEGFLKEAAKHRKFEVMVCECSPMNYVRQQEMGVAFASIEYLTWILFCIARRDTIWQ